MSKLGKRLIQAAREGRAIARGEADPKTIGCMCPRRSTSGKFAGVSSSARTSLRPSSGSRPRPFATGAKPTQAGRCRPRAPEGHQGGAGSRLARAGARLRHAVRQQLWVA